MKNIFINIDDNVGKSIFTRQDNNNAEIYKIYFVSNEGRVNLDGKSIKLGYNFAGTDQGDVLNLDITDSENGEVTLPITNKLTKKDGIFYCQFRIYGTNGYLENLVKFTLTVEKTVFSEITEGIEDIKGLTYVENLLDEAKELSGNLKVSITEGNTLNNSLEEKILEGSSLNNSLEDTINSAKKININLNTNLEQANTTITEVTRKKEELENTIYEVDTINAKLIENSQNAINLSHNLETNINLAESVKETMKDLDSKNIEATEKIEKLTDLNSESTELANLITEVIPLNSELVRNIGEAKVNDANLSTTNQTATQKKSELETSLAKTEKIIDGLNRSQNIPQIRLDLDELQKALKTNQSLHYEGSSISADNTIENRTEGMIINGRTYKNEMPSLDPENFTFAGKTNLEGDIFTTYMGANVLYDSFISCKLGKTNLKPNTKYSVIVDILENDTNESLAMITAGNFFYPNDSSNQFENKIGRSIVVGTTPSKRASWGDEFTFCIYPSGGDGNKKIKFKAMILEGDWRNKDFPEYFEGIKSFGEAEQDGSKYKIIISSRGKNLINENVFEDNIAYYLNGSNLSRSSDKYYKTFSANIEPYKNYYISVNTSSIINVVLFKNGIGMNSFSTPKSKLINGDYDEIKISVLKNRFVNIQLEEGTEATLYQKFKEDKRVILINEPLRSINDFKDIIYEDNGKVKLNRILGEYIFTGDENISKLSEENEETCLFMVSSDLVLNYRVNESGDLICNNFTSYSRENFKNLEGITSVANRFKIRIKKSKLTTQNVEGFKSWLKDNQTKVVYKLPNPITEVVEGVLDIDLDTYINKTYFSILNNYPGTLKFEVQSNIGSLIKNMAEEINNIWGIINNLIVPVLLETNKNIAMAKIKNNLE